jgi:allantoicase
MMKAIDRASRWSELLEANGFDIECETDVLLGKEYLNVIATKGYTQIRFDISMDTKMTRFNTGSRIFCGTYTPIKKASDMASIIKWEVEAA